MEVLIDDKENEKVAIRKTLEQRKKNVLTSEDNLFKHTFMEVPNEQKGEITKIRIPPDDFESEALEAEILEILSNKNSRQIQEIDMALERLDRGTYGFCITCHDPIPAERLKAVPETSQCLECQEDFERKARPL